MNSHLVWQTIQLCSMSWWIFSLPSSFVLLRKRCEQEKLLIASQHTFTIMGKRDKSHKDREGAMRRRATLVVPVDRPDPEFWCSVQVSSCHDSVSFTSCLFFWCIVAAASDNISFHSLTCHQVFSSLCFVSRQALDAGCKHGKSENDYYWILFPVLKKALKDFNNPELKWHLWRSGAVVCTLSSKWKKVPGLDALVLFCVEFALPPHLQGLGMQSSFRVLRLSYVNCWF